MDAGILQKQNNSILKSWKLSVLSEKIGSNWYMETKLQWGQQACHW